MKGKTIVYIGAAIISLILITSSVNVLGTQDLPSEKIQVTHKNVTSISEKATITGITPSYRLNDQKNQGTRGTDVPVTDVENNDNNPALKSDPDGELLLAYTYEEDMASTIIPWRYSTDKGQSFDPGVYFEIPGTESHPAIDYRGSAKRFVGTLQGDPVESSGAIQYLFVCDDPLDSATYILYSWIWSETYPYSDRRIPAIGGYDGVGIDWWYGITACVGTRGSPGSVDMPIFNYMDYVDENQGWSNYFAEYSGCENAAVDVDQTNGYFYAVFDYLNASLGHWDLLVFRGDCHSDGGSPDQNPIFFGVDLIGGTENTTHPAVAVHDDKVIILAETDEAGTQDIVCYYSSNAGADWSKKIVAGNAGNDEVNPTIFTYGDYATCTFMMNNDLYVTYTTDAGATWSAPVQVNDENGKVQSEYRNSDISDNGLAIWTDTRNGNQDIYLDDVGGVPPQATLEIGEIKGGLGKVSVTVKNIGDADASNVNITLTVDGGIFGRVHKEKIQLIPTLAINEEMTVTTDGFMFGLGVIEITARVSCPIAQPPVISKTATGTLLFILVTGIE